MQGQPATLARHCLNAHMQSGPFWRRDRRSASFQCEKGVYVYVCEWGEGEGRGKRRGNCRQSVALGSKFLVGALGRLKQGARFGEVGLHLHAECLRTVALTPHSARGPHGNTLARQWKVVKQTISGIIGGAWIVSPFRNLVQGTVRTVVGLFRTHTLHYTQFSSHKRPTVGTRTPALRSGMTDHRKRGVGRLKL